MCTLALKLNAISRQREKKRSLPKMENSLLFCYDKISSLIKPLLKLTFFFFFNETSQTVHRP